MERSQRKFAHSERLALPRITAPACRSCRHDDGVRGDLAEDERERAGGRLHLIGSRDVVLDQNRDAVKRAADVARLAFVVALFRDLKRVAIHLNDRVQQWIKLGDSREVPFDQLNGSETARSHQVLQLWDGRFKPGCVITKYCFSRRARKERRQTTRKKCRAAA